MTGPAGVLLPGFRGETVPGWLAARLDAGLAGVCLFASNISSPAQLRRLTAEVREHNPLALIAIDEEGGDVTRLHAATGSPHPGNALLGRLDDLALTEAVAARVGAELAEAGVNLDFAPDVDVNSTPLNPVIGVRSFGADPARVSRHGAAWVRGLQSAGVAATAKHFPGHGDTVQDSHRALPVVDVPPGVLRRRELPPFAAAIGAGVQVIMTSHILLPQIDRAAPATFSRAILGDLLRGELGFSGVVVSDALDMAGASHATGMAVAAVRAITAGCDLLCLGTDNDDRELAELEEALAAGAAADRLADAAARVAALAEGLTHPPRPASARTEVPLEAIAGAFDVRPGARVEGDRVLVALETAPNIAVGGSPWGPAAAGAGVLRATADSLPTLPAGAQPILVGKDNHLHAWVREYAAAIRQRHPGALVVDMGWPGEDRRYADVATFGASQLAGRALLAWLEGPADDR